MNKKLALVALVLSILLNWMVRCDKARKEKAPSEPDEELKVSQAVPMG